MKRLSIVLFSASALSLAIAAFIADSVGLGIVSLLLPVGIWASVTQLRIRLLHDVFLIAIAILATLSVFVGVPLAISLPSLTLALFAWHGLVKFAELDGVESDPGSRRKFCQRYGVIALSAALVLTGVLALVSQMHFVLNFGMALSLAFLAYGALMAFLALTGRQHHKDDPFR